VRRALSASLALLPCVLGGCSSISPDVVAIGTTKPPSKSDASTLFDDDGSLPAPRQAGTDIGYFSSSPVGDGASSPLFRGNIQFSLVEAPEGEFTVLKDDGTVIGTSESGSKFNANVKGEAACRSGRFKTYLYGGEYDLVFGGGVLPVAFKGTIDGTYVSDTNGPHGTYVGEFLGNWTALPDEADAQVPFATGVWTAILDR
jgi:hypothetical protein